MKIGIAFIFLMFSSAPLFPENYLHFFIPPDLAGTTRIYPYSLKLFKKLAGKSPGRAAAGKKIGKQMVYVIGSKNAPSRIVQITVEKILGLKGKFPAYLGEFRDYGDFLLYAYSREKNFHLFLYKDRKSDFAVLLAGNGWKRKKGNFYARNKERLYYADSGKSSVVFVIGEGETSPAPDWIMKMLSVR